MYGQAHRSVPYGFTPSDVPSRSPTTGEQYISRAASVVNDEQRLMVNEERRGADHVISTEWERSLVAGAPSR